ncbi:MAG: hypothetical protein Q4A31_02805 [Corynebacterium sp.]|uniref:hypothetical protein n=1 Tax=Corynebacterium sp. TaxID=1720 RepID=UPI0026DB72F3|nr:hypothetical protein [Corynebacterium sp.]MDO4760836.1 hypothetical protein [Corynebacterium sp.]
MDFHSFVEDFRTQSASEMRKFDELMDELKKKKEETLHKAKEKKTPNQPPVAEPAEHTTRANADTSRDYSSDPPRRARPVRPRGKVRGVLRRVER